MGRPPEMELGLSRNSKLHRPPGFLPGRSPGSLLGLFQPNVLCASATAQTTVPWTAVIAHVHVHHMKACLMARRPASLSSHEQHVCQQQNFRQRNAGPGEAGRGSSVRPSVRLRLVPCLPFGFDRVALARDWRLAIRPPLERSLPTSDSTSNGLGRDLSSTPSGGLAGSINGASSLVSPDVQ